MWKLSCMIIVLRYFPTSPFWIYGVWIIMQLLLASSILLLQWYWYQKCNSKSPICLRNLWLFLFHWLGTLYLWILLQTLLIVILLSRVMNHLLLMKVSSSFIASHLSLGSSMFLTAFLPLPWPWLRFTNLFIKLRFFMFFFWGFIFVKSAVTSKI